MKNDWIREEAETLFLQSSADTLEPFPDGIRRQYYKNGNRNDFEKLYFRRRDYLSACAVMALYDEEFIPLLEKIIVAICDEECWALPAHVPGIKFIDSRIIDLFVAETAFTLAEISVVFSEKLTCSIRQRIKSEIKNRLVKNYKRYRYWWEKCNMNWAAVCGGYTGGALLYLFPEEFKKQRKRLLKTLDCYIKGFTEDGFCLEGPLYWLYGFTAYTVFADLLYSYSQGKDDLFSSEKIKNIASYGGFCLLKGNTSLSFSDAQRDFLPDFALQKYLFSRFPDRVPYIENCNLCLYDANTKWMNYYRAIIWNSTDYAERKERNSTVFSKEANVLIVNKESYSFAIKGGHNNEPHNHNDLGSFIYSDKEGQVFCDLGSGRYTKDYFDEKKRYDIFCNSSFSHSVPVINEKGQPTGKTFTAKLTYEKGTASCTLEKAYKEKNLKSASRKAELKENGLLLKDSFVLKENIPVTERFVSLRKAETENGMLIFGNTYMRYPAQDVILSITEETHTPHEYDKEDITVYCYDFILKEGINEVSFEITTK